MPAVAVDLHLRPATPADWALAWPIQREAFLESVTATWGGWTDEQVRKCEAAWAPERTRLILRGEALLGWVRVEHADGYDWLDLIVVDPAHLRRGVGEAVMRELMAEAAARSVPLALSVYRTNPARRLYARLGFAEHPRDELRVLMTWPASAPAPSRPPA